MSWDYNTQQGKLDAQIAGQTGGIFGPILQIQAMLKDMQVGLSQQGEFEVDPERLPQLKADLDKVAEEVEEARRVALELQNIDPPAKDDVSIQSVANIKKVIEDGDGSLIKTCEDIRLWVKSFQDQVEKAVAEYQRIDEENRM